MSGLSALARVLRKHAFEDFAPEGSLATNERYRQPVRRGLTRGSLGSTGARGIQSRNPDAQADEERQFMQSPIFSQMMQGLS